jgi:hypothetical protein
MSGWTKFLPVIVSVTGTIGTAVFTPGFLLSHPVIFSELNALAMLLHAALPSVFGGAK